MNIILVGYRCSGKTEVGRMLAKEMGRDFIDTDVLIEKDAGYSIETIIKREGWDHFRKIEKRIIKEVSKRDDLIIATGGGVVMNEENVMSLKKNGFIIWLNGKGEVLKERMERDQRSGRIRPSLTGADPLEEIEAVLDVRNPLYERAGDLMVDTSHLSISEVVNSIIRFLPEKGVR